MNKSIIKRMYMRVPELNFNIVESHTDCNIDISKLTLISRLDKDILNSEFFMYIDNEYMYRIRYDYNEMTYCKRLMLRK